MPAPWPPAHALFCLVTDRLALAAAKGGGADPIGGLRQQVAAAADAGVDLVHLRERDLGAGALADLASECVERTRGSSTRVVVNDRVDVALAAGADGVHLRGDSVDARRLRARLADGLAGTAFLVGRSIRHADEARALGGLDYLVLGTVFASASKPGLEALAGLDGLSAAVRATRTPVLAIGGVAEDRIADVAGTGAAGVAGIRLFFPGSGGWKALPQRVASWRRAFDTSRPIT